MNNYTGNVPMKTIILGIITLLLFAACDMLNDSKDNSEVVPVVTTVELTSDKTEVFSNGVDKSILYVVLKTANGEVVNNESTILYANGAELTQSHFSTNTSGTYIVKAANNGIFSNEITIVANPEVAYATSDLQGTWSLNRAGTAYGTATIDASGVVTQKPSGTNSKYIGNMFPNALTITVDGVTSGSMDHKDRYTVDKHTYTGQLNALKNTISGTLETYQRDIGSSNANITTFAFSMTKN